MTLRYLLLAFFLFLSGPSSQMSHAGQITEVATHASEVSKTPSPSVGSGDWIGLFLDVLKIIAFSIGAGAMLKWTLHGITSLYISIKRLITSAFEQA